MAKQVQRRGGKGPEPRSTGSGRPVRRGAPPRRTANNQVLLWVIIAAVALIVVGVVLAQSNILNRTPTAQGATGEGIAWGPANAPVTVIEYSNFGCSHCRAFAEGAGKQLRQEYEAGGKVRFNFRPFSLGSAEPDAAANAALCAADQARFWDYHDLLFAKQGVSANSFSPDALKQYGQQLGLDMAKFNTCVDNSQHADQVHQYSQEGLGQGVNATPTTFVNGQRIEGDVPYNELKAVVENALKSAGS